jgi:uncharacterized zinc-type alcohol dehydrogenase-like protein
MKVSAYAANVAKSPLSPFSYELSDPGPNDVDIRVTHCGICHSDIAMIDNDWQWSQYPLVAGHEVVGTVERIGSAVTNVKPGQRVGLGWQCDSCGHCEFCATGRENVCANERDTIVGRPGGFGNFVRTNARFAIAIPDALDSAGTAPLMCAGTTVFSPIRRHQVTSGMRTAVVGVGGLGHLAVQFLAKMGCEVTAISSSHDKDAEARKLGATKFIATKSADELKKAARSFDFVICTASSSVDWSALVATLRPDGQFVLCGIPEKEVSIYAIPMILGETSFTGGRAGSPSDTAAMLDFAARHNIIAMTETFPFTDINKAIERTRSGKARWRVVLKH